MATWYKTVIQEFKEGETDYLEISIYEDRIFFKDNVDYSISIDMDTFKTIEYLINQTE